jgi:hypothetical protein
VHFKRISALIIAIVTGVSLLVAPAASAQVPWNHPQLFFHTVLTSNQSQILIQNIPNSHSTLRLNLRGQSTDTNTAARASQIKAQLNANINNYSWGYQWWLFNCCSGGGTNFNQNDGGIIGQITDSSSISDAEGSGAITCTWIGYSQATWDHQAFCDQTYSETNLSSGLARLITSMIWRPSSPAAINSIMLFLADGSQFETGTIVDLYLE